MVGFEHFDKSVCGLSLTHAILDRLGLIKQAEENADEPEEDSEDLRYLRLCLCRICRVSGEPLRPVNGGIRAFRQICVWFVYELTNLSVMGNNLATAARYTTTLVSSGKERPLRPKYPWFSSHDSDHRPLEHAYTSPGRRAGRACPRQSGPPCNRCSVYNHPCLFRERKATQTKVYSRG
jgi:hypothetical protein